MEGGREEGGAGGGVGWLVGQMGLDRCGLFISDPCKHDYVKAHM